MSDGVCAPTLSHDAPPQFAVVIKKSKFSLSVPSLSIALKADTSHHNTSSSDRSGREAPAEAATAAVPVAFAALAPGRSPTKAKHEDAEQLELPDAVRREHEDCERRSFAQRTLSSQSTNLRGRKTQQKLSSRVKPFASSSSSSSLVASIAEDDHRAPQVATLPVTFAALTPTVPPPLQAGSGSLTANTTANSSMAGASVAAIKPAGGSNSGSADGAAANATLNQERVNQRVSRIYPLTDSVYVAKSKKTPVEVKFHPITSHFVNESRLEKLYQVTFARENSPRSSRIASIFFLLYLIFTGSNLTNLLSDDPKVRAESLLYCLLVFTPITPIPFLIYLSRQRKYEIQFQRIYTVILLCWAFSLISGGMYSMLTEWYNYVAKDVGLLMGVLGLDKETGPIYYVNSTSLREWQFEALQGTRREVLESYTRKILLPAATMNINLLRLIMVFAFIPLLRIDTLHFAIVGILTSVSYDVLTFMYFPSTDSGPFTQNRILVLCFPIVFALVMLVRNRDVDRVIRQDFLHVWAVELEAEKATREKNLIAEENRNLKKELAQRDSDFTLDLTSPLHSILAELKNFLDDTDMTDANMKRGLAILKNLSKLDTNLFMPDIRAQMKSKEEGVDNDTKNWALSVLARKDYQGTTRANATLSVSSHSNSDTRRSYQDITGIANQNGVIVPLGHMPSWEEDALSRVKTRIHQDGWDLDTLLIAEITHGRPLMYVTAAMFDIHELHEEFRIEKVVLRNFLFTLDDGYLANPYHNSSHAADVVNSVNYLMTRLNDGQIRDTLTNLEFYAALVAAAIHDFRHPGKSNNYMIKCKHDLAIQYNDRSILESMHLAETFFVMRSPNCDIFGRMKDKPYREIRKAIIEMVLSTDLSMHLQLVGNLKALMIQESSNGGGGGGSGGGGGGAGGGGGGGGAGGGGGSSRSVTDPMMIMKVVIKCADIGHAAKERRLHVIWSSLIIEEFFLQGDNERANNSDISPFMDRHSENSAKVQHRKCSWVSYLDDGADLWFGYYRTKWAFSSLSCCRSTRPCPRSCLTGTFRSSTISPSKTTVCGKSRTSGSSRRSSRSRTRCFWTNRSKCHCLRRPTVPVQCRLCHTTTRRTRSRRTR